MIGTGLAHRLGWIRRSLLTIWIATIFVSLVGWGVAAVIAVIAFRTFGGFCP
jgi:hypothetical protein